MASPQRLVGVLPDGTRPEGDGFAVAERISEDRRYAGTKLVMLTSAGQPEDVARCRKLGISAYLTKPIKQSELFDVIVGAVGQPVEERASAPKRRKRSRPALRKLQLLVSEDNQVNQLLPTRLCSISIHQ